VGSRRRVPGLRREEVAQLAGVSVDYYARLEKGHLETASPAVLEAIARALRFDEAERSHLHALARATRGEEPHQAPCEKDVVVRPGPTWMLDAMTQCPAYIRNGRLDVLASNAMARALYEPMFDSADDPPNLALFCFLDDRALEFFPEWPDVAQGMMALLRTALGRNSSDEALNELVDRLASHSEAFRTLWASHNVRQAPAETARIRHPAVGTLSLALEALNLTADPGLTMVTYAAEPGSASADRLLDLMPAHGAKPPVAPS
jgi:hypothetical protein